MLAYLTDFVSSPHGRWVTLVAWILAAGLDFPSTAVRVRMLEESIEIMKRLWSEEEVSLQGAYYSLTSARNDPKPAQKPHPPFLIGGHGQRHLFRAVARYADICSAGFEMGLDEHRATLDVLGEHCQTVGRDISSLEVTHNTRVVIAENGAEFDRLVSQGATTGYVSQADYRGLLSRAISGTPEQCTEQIQKYVDAGITYFFLLFPTRFPPKAWNCSPRK